VGCGGHTWEDDLIIVAGRLHIDRTDRDRRDRYVAECVAIVQHARTAPGCLDFAITADSVEADRINVYERWESAELLERFRGSDPDAGQTAQLHDAHVRRYRISATEDPWPSPPVASRPLHR
jgi:quinol monooxygenase YgiN